MTAKLIERTRFAALLQQAEQLQWTTAHADALPVLEQALTLATTDLERYDVAESLLRGSNCTRGWDLYDLHPSRPVDRLPGIPIWDGDFCPTLVVVADQGFGDAIQSMRFIPRLSGRAGEIVVALQDKLFEVTSTSPLLAGCTVMPKSRARKRTWPSGTRWERMMSLPAKVPRPDVGPAAPYLVADPDAGPKLPALRDRPLTVGVAWRTTQRRIGPNRSVPLHLMRTLIGIDGVRVVPLHRNRDIRGALPGAEIVTISNFRDTAAVITQCDLVVTADTVTAHLAPALGVPTLICLLHRPDWRWGTPDNPTTWYAAAELAWQDERRQWTPVLARIADRLRDRTISGGQT